MNFKPELLAKVLAGTKTQTRRPVKPSDEIENFILPDYDTGQYHPRIVRRNGRIHYEVGKVYAVCPGRGKSGQGFVRLTKIRTEDVRTISIPDARAEGFEYPGEFLKVWCGFYDKAARWEFDSERVDYWINTGKHRELVGWETVLEIINARPAELYQGYALTFERITLQAPNTAPITLDQWAERFA